MIEYLGRENMEDYNASFEIMYEAWEAAVVYSRGTGGKYDAISIAKLLGWTRVKQPDKKTRKVRTILSDVASACSHVHDLVKSGDANRDTFKGNNVSEVKVITQSMKKDIA